MEIEDEDIKVLMQVTLLTPTASQLRLTVPFHLKFRPSAALLPDCPLLLPLYHSLRLDSGDHYADIDIQPLLSFMDHEHFLNVQTYGRERGEVSGPKYTLRVSFCQTVVFEKRANELEVVFRKIVFSSREGKQPRGQVQVRLLVSHGSSWTGATANAAEVVRYQQTAVLMYRSLLDSIVFQIWSGKEKLNEGKVFVFELLADSWRGVQLDGALPAIAKLAARPSLPILPIETDC